MTFYDDPNREAIGLEPIWTGAGGEPEGFTAGEQDGGASGSSAFFDPGAHTVAEVEDYVAEHPEQRDAVLEAELAGKGRTTLVTSLEDG